MLKTKLEFLFVFQRLRIKIQVRVRVWVDGWVRMSGCECRKGLTHIPKSNHSSLHPPTYTHTLKIIIKYICLNIVYFKTGYNSRRNRMARHCKKSLRCGFLYEYIVEAFFDP